MRIFSKPKILGTCLFLFTLAQGIAQQSILYGTSYYQDLANSKDVKVIELCVTPGGQPLNLIKLGNFDKKKPVVFLAANMEGNQPTTADAAIWFTRYLAKNQESFDYANWYILPCGNPDAQNHYFETVKCESKINNTIVNNDNDEIANEDGLEDLNKDGFITKMLVKDPLGEYMKDTADSRIIRKADPLKGEKGIYKQYTEGIDNDKDGKYNEDPIGGVNINRNFSYQFESFVPVNGKWSGSEPESFAIMKFFAEHPEITMVIVLGEKDNLVNPLKLADDSKGNKGSIKVPSYLADHFGFDAQKMYSPEELEEFISSNIENKSTGKQVYNMLINQKQPTSIQPDDLKTYVEVSKEYTKYLKSKGDSLEYASDSDWANGSFEQFAYYQRGLPVFNMNLLFVPKNKEKAGKKGAIEASKTSDNPIKSFLTYADSMKWDVFIPWTKMKLQEFEDSVEIGGLKPYVMSNPPKDSLEGIFEKQLPYLLELAAKMPTISYKAEIKESKSGIVTIEVFVTNNGQLSYPMSIGDRNEKPSPLILCINKEVELLSGLHRTPVGIIKPMETKKFTFVISKTKSQKEATFNIESKNITTTPSNLKIEIK